MSISFKNYVNMSEEQLSELFGVFKNNQKLEKQQDKNKAPKQPKQPQQPGKENDEDEDEDTQQAKPTGRLNAIQRRDAARGVTEAMSAADKDRRELERAVERYTEVHGHDWQAKGGNGLLAILKKAFPARKVRNDEPARDVITNFTHKTINLIKNSDDGYAHTGSFDFHGEKYYYMWRDDIDFEVSEKPYKERSYS